jgi:hypothetical protein
VVFRILPARIGTKAEGPSGNRALPPFRIQEFKATTAQATGLKPLEREESGISLRLFSRERFKYQVG